jgi:hypothetical protein
MMQKIQLRLHGLEGNNRYVNVFSDENGQCLEAAQQEFLRSLLGVTEADSQTTTDMRL